ncbi:Fumitremorgin C monooxygenase [Madurella mycetomatis]|uniref:Fumitremorgin C monooxygenase n=1 Tax=Madurella mycetomatis TaxID=100816 RepID=A0A175WAY6_9PEZI|nr:Fumitremorgin C monooxygenase [Madurella mycetomatis]
MLVEFLLSVHTWSILAILAGAYLLLRPRRRPAFPIINRYPGDFLGRRAYREAHENASKLITEGLAKYQGPITVAIPHGQKIILPSSLTGWVKSNRDLDHKQLVREDFCSGIPGFEALSVLHDPDEMLIGVIKTKMGQNDSTMAAMDASLAKGFQVLWGNDKTWHTIDWQKDTMGIIARAASSVFVGPEKADDPEWLDLVQGYVLAFFTGVSDLHRYPAWSRSIVHWFLPSAIACRKYVSHAREIMNEVIRKRQEEVKRAALEGKEHPAYNDALAWVQAASGGRAEAGDVQLSLAMAALFTTTELFRQLLIEIARHPELVEPLRNEVSEQISLHGISVAATSNMVLLDSFMKESQRQTSGLVVLERIASIDTVLPDGKVIPRGSHIMVDSTDLWNPAVYPNPDQFDAYRFLRRRQAGDKSSQFIQSSPDYNVFGGGRHICPGRFFASNELKLALAHLLSKYEIRLAKGCEPKNLQRGFYAMADPFTRLEVRRKDGPKM